MLTIKKVINGNVLDATLSGSLDETANLESEFVGSWEQVNLNCKSLVRINSAGIRIWIDFFGKLSNLGIRLVFKECSSSVVQQMNAISNFRCGGLVESLVVPFCCEKCGAEFQQVFPLDKLAANKFQLPIFKCPKCQGKLVFDDDVDEYFGCFKRK